MLPGEKKEVRRRQREIQAALDTETVYFYDATTHSLGDPALGARPLTSWLGRRLSQR
jgi:hypothetical protein